MQDPPIDRKTLDSYLGSHCIPVDAIRADDFKAFMVGRQAALLTLIARATGHALSIGPPVPEEGQEPTGALAHDTGLDSEAD